MKSVLLLSSAVVIFTIFGIVGGSIDYISLMKNVYDKYMTKSIIIVPSRNFLSFEKISIIHAISRGLSARGIPLLILNYVQLREGMKYHSTESHYPLVVMFLDDLTALHSISEEIVHVDISYSQQLVVFFGDSDQDHCRYCRNPIGNIFDLKFNSQMLVMCCESEYIEEWWSRRENQTSSMPRGKWIETVNKVNWYPEGSIHTNRLSMDNKGLRILTFKESVLAWREHNQLHGYMGEILMELSRHLNFSILQITEENVSGSWDTQLSMWSGAIGTIVRGDADIGVGEFSTSPDRMLVIDFSVPLSTFKRALFIKKPDDVNIVWDACFKPFHGEVWMVILILLLITPFLLTIIKYRRRNNFFDMISQHYLNVWGIFCQLPLPDSPYGAPLRIVYISIYMMAVILSAAYSASFISYLTTISSNLPFHTWEEFAQDGTYKLALRRDRLDELKMSNEELYEKLKAKMLPMDSLPRSRTEGLKQICTQKWAFYDADIINHNYSPCKIIPIPVGGVKTFAMIMPLKSEYKKAMNHFLRQFEYNGMTTRLEDKYFKKKDAAHTYYEPVTFRGILPILIVSIAGFSIAFVIFCIELPRTRG